VFSREVVSTVGDKGFKAEVVLASIEVVGERHAFGLFGRDLDHDTRLQDPVGVSARDDVLKSWVALSMVLVDNQEGFRVFWEHVRGLQKAMDVIAPVEDASAKPGGKVILVGVTACESI